MVLVTGMVVTFMVLTAGSVVLKRCGWTIITGRRRKKEV